MKKRTKEKIAKDIKNSSPVKFAKLKKSMYDHGHYKGIHAAVKVGKATSNAVKGLKEFKKSEHKKDYIKDKLKDTPKHIKNKVTDTVKTVPKKAVNHLKEYDTINTIITKGKEITEFVVRWGKLIAIVLLIVIVVSNGVLFGIGIAQSVGPTPHYYCSINPGINERSSTVYKQYCSQSSFKNTWTVNNINGHYIVQDGPGPADACAMLNMMIRYYTLSDVASLSFGSTNVYDYLWQNDGQYTIKGNRVGKIKGKKNTVRQLFNRYSDVTCDDTQTSNEIQYFKFNDTDSDSLYSDDINTNIYNNPIMNVTTTNLDDSDIDPNYGTIMGSRYFAKRNDKHNSSDPNEEYKISNWGYLRDDEIDIPTYLMVNDFYTNQADNSYWVWDLSLNTDKGTTWNLNNWNTEDLGITINGIPFKVEQMTCPVGDVGYESVRERILQVLSSTDRTVEWYNSYDGYAGVMLQYTKTPISGQEQTTIDNDTLYTGNNRYKGEYKYNNKNDNGSKITHTILITKYDNNNTEDPSDDIWYGIDSSLGVCGGWEGPLIDSQDRFVSNGDAISKMLNNTSTHKVNNRDVQYFTGKIDYTDGYTYSVKKIGYCIKPDISSFGFNTITQLLFGSDS